jgi:hypothetical protein
LGRCCGFRPGAACGSEWKQTLNEQGKRLAVGQSA